MNKPGNNYTNPQYEELKDNEAWAEKRNSQSRISGYKVDDPKWEKIFKRKQKIDK